MEPYESFVRRLEEDTLFVSILEGLEDSGVELDSEEFSETFAEVLEKGVPRATDALGRALQELSDAMLCDWASLQAGFETRLRKRWAKPFDALRTTVVGCYELGKAICEEEQVYVEPGEYRFEALRRIHAKACQTAWEVVCLIESGYAKGALARWRTLHELSVVALFLVDRDDWIAERYLLHQYVESFDAARQINQHAEALGMTPISDGELQELREDVADLKERFGKSFGARYGWAVDALGKTNPKFYHLEKTVRLEYLRPFVKLACHGIHAGPKGLFFDPGLTEDVRNLMLVGSSNTGFTDAAQLTATSLVRATGTLVALKPGVDRLVMMNAVARQADEVGESFFEVQQELERLPYPPERNAPTTVRLVHWLRQVRCRIRRALRRS